MAAGLKIIGIRLFLLVTGIWLFIHVFIGFHQHNFRPWLRANYSSKKLSDLASLLRAISHEVSLLNLEVSSPRRKLSSTAKFGIFENETSAILRGKFHEKLSDSGWTLDICLSPDPRLLNKVKKDSVRKDLISHIIIYNTWHFAHLAVLIPRYDYYWIAGLNFSNKWRLEELPRAIDKLLLNHLERRNDDDIRLFEPSDKPLWLWHQQYSTFLECNYDSIVWPFRRFFHQFIEAHNESLVRSVHQTIRRLSLNHRIPIQIYAGSLLGWYRQCDFIPYSKDVDLIINETYFSYELFKDIWNGGELKMVLRYSRPREGFEVISQHIASGIQTDLFTWHFEPTVENVSYVGYYVSRSMSVYRYTYPIITELCTGDLLGVLVYVPCDPELSLEAEYPEGWFLPRKSFASQQSHLFSRHNKSEWRTFMYHNYKNYSCVEPSMLTGCD